MEHGDYISKAKVAAEFDFMEKYVFCYGDRDDISEAKKRILRIKPENVEKVRTGEWKPGKSCVLGGVRIVNIQKCSVCENDSIEYSKYCPNCGAKMR